MASLESHFEVIVPLKAGVVYKFAGEIVPDLA
jgi:hypothetical protein